MSTLLDARGNSALRSLLSEVLEGAPLTGGRARAAIDGLCSPEADTALQVGLLTALRARGETAAEVGDLARALRDKARGPICSERAPLLDTCGTGGDGSDSVNLSTLAALTVAAAGVAVAKHGNRAVSSRCGSADLVTALGIPLQEVPADASRALDHEGFAFLFAPAFHPAAGAVAPARKLLKARTVFNLLGPLVNPARPTHQVLGACDEPTAELLAEALATLDVRRAYVVHGSPGWDEATPCGPFLRLTVEGGAVHSERIDPRVYGIERCSPQDLAGGDVARNAHLAREMLGGAAGPIRDAVLLNAALALEVVGAETDPRAAFARAAEAIDSGAALALVDRLGGASA